MDSINQERSFEVFTFRAGNDDSRFGNGRREDTALMIDVNIIDDDAAERIEEKFDNEIIENPDLTDLQKFDALVKLIRAEIKLAEKEAEAERDEWRRQHSGTMAGK